MNTLGYIGLCSLFCVAGAAVFYRHKKVGWLPFGTGFGIDSPDGRHRAHAADYIDESFWGRKTRFYGFEVTKRGTGETIAKHEMPRVRYQDVEDSESDFYSDVVVHWSSDSRRVRVELRGKTVWEYELTHDA